jgi:threonine dehydrogenase-like Zn-dependent dehydrogenase
MSMDGIWLEDRELSFSRDLQRPEPPPGEALVRVRLAGICATDLELVRGYYPFRGIPGHEFVGEVTAAPDDPSWVGKRVVGEINAVCGSCPTCRAGRPSHCEQRDVLGIIDRHGAFARYLTLPLANLHPVPDDLADEIAVFCEPLAAALQVLQQVQVRPADRVLVIGAGRLGQLLAQVLAITGCTLEVVARHENQRRTLLQRGITPLPPDDVEPGRADVVVEASGSPDGFELALGAVRPRGTIVLKSTYHGRLSTSLTKVVVDEVTVIGSRCGPFPPALRLLRRPELVDPAPLIEARYPLSDGIAALEHAARPGALKVLLIPGSHDR